MKLSRASAKYLVTVMSLFVVLAAYAVFQLSKSRTFQLFGEVISRIDTTRKVVALTLDDAPTDNTDDVLGVLRSKDIKATFYVIGESGRARADVLKRIVSAGHELGNHSFTHQRFLLTSPSFVRDEIESTNQVIRDAGYSGEITFRPPYGKKLVALPWYLSTHNIRTIMFDVEPDTYHPRNAGLLRKYTLDNVKPGSIILLHPLCGTDCSAARDALPGIIDALRGEGYAFVTVGELLRYDHAGAKANLGR
jgi:chitin deacetylase